MHEWDFSAEVAMARVKKEEEIRIGALEGQGSL